MSKETEVHVAEPPVSPEEPEQPEKTERHPAKQSSGSTGAFLAMLLALSALGAAYYIWQQQNVVRSDVKALEGSINRLVEAIEQRHSRQQEQLEAMVEHHHPESERKQAQLESLLLKLRSRLSQERSDWTLAEVEYLIRVADHRLVLNKDPQTAIAALNQAVQKTTLLSHPELQGTTDQLNRDIAALSAINLPDKAKIATTLAELSAEIPQWPFAAGTVSSVPDSPAVETPTQPQKNQSELNRALSRVWADIKGLVTIRRSDEVSRPLMDTEQRYFLQQNLRLKLESARLALLAGHNRPYHDSLNEAISWLQQYYDTASPLVIEADVRIQQLAAIDLEPTLPSLKDSLLLLQKAVFEIQAQQTVGTLPDIAEEAPTDNETAPTALPEQDPSLTEEPPAIDNNAETAATQPPAPAQTPLADQPDESGPSGAQTDQPQVVEPQQAPVPPTGDEVSPPSPESVPLPPARGEAGEISDMHPPNQAPIPPKSEPVSPQTEQTVSPQNSEPGTVPSPQTPPPADVPGEAIPPAQGIRL